MTRLIARLWLVFFAAGPVLTGCSVGGPNIVSISPDRDANEVGSNQSVLIGFDRPMNHESVESRFEMRPLLAGCSASSAACRFSWSNNVMSFDHPKVHFALHTRYTVFLHGGYADTAGQRNTLEHSWTFTTESAPALTAADPADGANGVPTDTNLLLSFNHPMDLATLSQTITISPAVPFVLRSKPTGERSQAEIVPLELLNQNTGYSVVIDGAFDARENRLPSAVVLRFRTGPLSISRKIGYLVGQRGQPALGIGIVDPHPDPFLGHSIPKFVFQLPVGERDHDAILSFDWNPDSTQVVLVDAFRGASEGRLLIYDVAKRSLTDLKQTASSVAWSPTGSSIVFSSRGLLYMYRPASGDTVQLSRQGIVQPPIAISPDGTSVAFAVSDSSGSLPHLALINLDLRTQYRPIGLGDPADNPAWSFDGTKLAFRRYTPSGRELWVYDLTASGQASYRRLGPLDISGAAWLSDNSTVIASVGQDSTSALYRINVFAGGDPVKITGGPDAPNGSSPSAPPYDRRIGFASRVGDIPQIFVMNGDGSHPQELTDWEADYPYTGWAPNWTSG